MVFGRAPRVGRWHRFRLVAVHWPSYIRGDETMAEEAGGSTETRTEDMHWGLLLRADMQDLRQGLRQDMRDLRQEVQQDMRDFRQEVQQDLRVARQEVQQDLT